MPLRQNEINTLVQAYDVIQTTNGLQASLAAKRGFSKLAPGKSAAHVNLCVVKVQKMVSSNGRWRVPDDSDEPKDPDNDFPFQQAYTDCSGQQREFVFSCFRTSLGFGVQAEEEGKEGEGFFFREFDPNSPYLALYRLQRRIRKMLATRHIEELASGDFQATHQTVRGRISYAEGAVAFVIDGQLLTLQQFEKLIATFEGFEFQLEIQD